MKNWRQIPRFSWSGATARLLGATVVGATAALLAPASEGWLLRGLIGWDAGAVVLLAAHWLRIFQATSQGTRKFSADDDPGRRVSWLVAICASIFSLGSGVVILRQTAHLPDHEVALRTALALVGIALAWLVAHTLYTLRYAHLFYRRLPNAGGLAFPATKDPNDLDFAYFSFTMGMTCQTSDVGIETTEIRTAVLGHGLLSFVFNTTIVGLSLNLLIQFFSR